MPAMPSSDNLPTTPVNRRDFLALATRGVLALNGLLGVGMLLRFLSHPPAPSSANEVDLGPASNFPIGSQTVMAQANLVLLHTEAGFQALSLECPHLGCLLNPEPGGFSCPCHGSRFDSSGALLRGPASKNLKPLSIEQNHEGHLIVRY